MERPCDKCANYSKTIDEFRQQFVDKIVLDDSGREQHFCPMYDNHIPTEIWDNAESCPFFRDK